MRGVALVQLLNGDGHCPGDANAERDEPQVGKLHYSGVLRLIPSARSGAPLALPLLASPVQYCWPRLSRELSERDKPVYESLGCTQPFAAVRTGNTSVRWLWRENRPALDRPVL